MKVINAHEAHLRPHPLPNTGFSVLHNPAIFTDSAHADNLQQALFTADTIPLSESQRSVVHALLSHHSVLCTAVAGDEKDAILLDLVMRTRVWKESIVYCASSRRAAEAFFATLCAQLGPERRNEILLDFGDGPSHCLDHKSNNADSVRVVITSPSVLRKAVVSCDSHPDSWATKASIIFIDNLTDSNLSDWEELLLSLPSRILVCVMTRQLERTERDLLPLWIETIQNSVVSISPTGASSLLDRIERPQSFPLLRTFAFNAALHESPVQVSLTILKDMMQKEIEDVDGNFVPDYAESFLQGITMIPAEPPSDLLFSNADEAAFADVAALIIADVKRTNAAMRSKNRRRTRTKKKERTPASRAAARRRREAAYADALLLPATVLVKGHAQTEAAAMGVKSALGDVIDIIWDEDTRDHIEDIVMNFKSRIGDQLTENDQLVLDLLVAGIGIVHDRYTPSLRILVEELYRGGHISVLVADTFLGSSELCSLPSSKSVVVESEVLSTCDDESKGLIVASTPVSLAGRVGKDDVGNLIMMWYHESIDDETAGHEIASNVLLPALSSFAPGNRPKRARPHEISGRGFQQARSSDIEESERETENKLFLTYDSVLRSLRRFGVDGYESIYEYGLNSFKRWAQRGALHATLEKLSIEKKVIEETLEKENWQSIAEYSRRVAKVNEVERVFKAMTTRFEAVRSRRLLEELRSSRPGRIIGVRSGEGTLSPITLERLLPTSSTENVKESKSSTPVSEADDQDTQDVKKDGLSVIPGRTGKDFMAAAAFVTVLDQEQDGKPITGLKSRYLIVCILADGIWTMVPLNDVIAMAREEDRVDNVDLLMMPHPATFDVDPSTEWAKCAPIDAGEQGAVHRVSDDLIARMAADDHPKLTVVEVAEFEAQKEHVERMREQHRQSPWYGREDEMNELRRLRRRSAELSDEMKTLQGRKNRFEEDLMSKQNDQQGIQRSLMAVLEDCHAVSYLGEKAMEMTPIGALASILPSRFPLFAGACLSLIDDMEHLTAPKFAAFVALVVCDGRVWSMADLHEEDEEEEESEEELLDLSNIRRASSLNKWSDEEWQAGNGGNRSIHHELDKLSDILPVGIRDAIAEIQKALHQLHRRHLAECHAVERVDVSDVVPTLLNTRMSEAIYRFTDGTRWGDTVQDVGNQGGYALREMRRVANVLELISADKSSGEFSEGTRAVAGEALSAMMRWPVRDTECIRELLDQGVVEKTWSGNTYDKWWRSVREFLSEVDGAKEAGSDGEGGVSGAEAEIVEMP